MSKTYKDEPYRVKKNRLGTPKKTPTEARTIDTSRHKKIVAFFYSHEVKEIERFELALEEYGYNFKKHEVHGNLLSAQYWDGKLSAKEMNLLKKNHNPLGEHMYLDRLGLLVEGQVYKLAPEISFQNPIHEKITNYLNLDVSNDVPKKTSKSNVFFVYEIEAVLPNWWGQFERHIEGEDLELCGKVKIAANACSCSICKPDEGEKGHVKTRTRAIVSRAKNEYNNHGELNDETEDSFDTV